MAPAGEDPRGRGGDALAGALGCVLATLALGLTLGACGAAATTPARPADLTATATVSAAAIPGVAAEAPCATNTDAEIARATGVAARHIYALELASSEVRADKRQVEGYAPLLSALAAGNRAGVSEAVSSLVFSHTHVVRLRVMRGGKVLADVGGPYILAPVGGRLRLNGRTLGRYLLSVQDDSGYVKLESRYIGDALLMRMGSRVLPVEGALPAAAGSLPAEGPAAYLGKRYRMLTLAAAAFPSGTLRISLLVPAPRQSALGCRAVQAEELARIGERAWQRFATVGAPPSAFIRELGGLTGALAYVRSGARQLAGSTNPGPARLPSSGAVRYRGRTYLVSSFAAQTAGEGVRVYQLIAL